MQSSAISAVTIAPSSGQHRSTCIFLHGLGDSGHGWADVAMMLAKKLPFTKFVLPHAPSRKVTMNGGVKMPAWYDFYGLSQDSPQDTTGILRCAESILKLIKEESSKTGIGREKIIIGGFSQGGAVALTSGLLYKSILADANANSDAVEVAEGKDFAGIVSLSTYLPIHEHFLANADRVAKKTPILMVHGTRDGVIRPEWAKASAELMQKQLKCDALQFTKIHGLTHSITGEEIEMMAKFMKECLKE